MTLVACGHSEYEEVYPIRFGNNDITVKLMVTNHVSFVDGGGEYRISVGSPDVIAVPVIDNDTRTLKITPLAKGESTVLIYDVRANKAVKLNVKVVDFYISCKVMAVEGTNLNPYVAAGDEIRFIRTDDDRRLVDVVRGGEFVADGCFDIDLDTSAGRANMHFGLHSYMQATEELEPYLYKISNNSAAALDIINHLFGFGWQKPAAAGRSLPVFYPRLELEAPNGCVISGILTD